jgi:hypothetical protein
MRFLNFHTKTKEDLKMVEKALSLTNRPFFIGDFLKKEWMREVRQ